MRSALSLAPTITVSRVIKYLGSKRRLVGVIGEIAASVEQAATALDLFTGTTRVAQVFKGQGLFTTAFDQATYSEVFAKCYIETDATAISRSELEEALSYLSSLPPRAGYFTETFCLASRFVQPFNGARIDAIRDAIEADFTGTALYPVLLTSLLEAADRVDSTAGLQMAYLKSWAPRSFNPLQLRAPALLSGPGRACRGDAHELAGALGDFDIAYLDPPYNQHRYFTNYHLWETLVRWDAPEHYGVACKRTDSRDESTRSVFNSRSQMPSALRRVVEEVRARLLILSYNSEAWISREDLEKMCDRYEHVTTLAFDSKRYVGAQIGIFNPDGARVGEVSHLRNLEYVIVAGPEKEVRRATAGFRDARAELAMLSEPPR